MLSNSLGSKIVVGNASHKGVVNFSLSTVMYRHTVPNSETRGVTLHAQRQVIYKSH